MAILDNSLQDYFFTSFSLHTIYFQATKPDVLAKRDSSVEVDPYAAYYEQYSNAVHTTGLTEKQGFAGAMENVFGDDAAVSSL